MISTPIREDLLLTMNTIAVTEEEVLTVMTGALPAIKAEALKVVDGILTKMTMSKCPGEVADGQATNTGQKDVSKCLILMKTEVVTEDKEIHRADSTKDVIPDTIRNLIMIEIGPPAEIRARLIMMTIADMVAIRINATIRVWADSTMIEAIPTREDSMMTGQAAGDKEDQASMVLRNTPTMIVPEAEAKQGIVVTGAQKEIMAAA